jgi:hypothetical protein
MTFLIQRVTRRHREESRGVDRHFIFDYMGSAEFEYGALPEALKRMRLSKGFEVQVVKVEVKGVSYKAWAVCRPEEYPEVVETFVDQLGPRKLCLKERTNMANAYGLYGRLHKRSQPCPVTGWWALDSEVPWLLFMKKKSAKLWLATYGGTP